MLKESTTDPLKLPSDLKEEAHLVHAQMHQVESALAAHPHNVKARKIAHKKTKEEHKAESGTVEIIPKQEPITPSLIKDLEEYMTTGIGPSAALDSKLTSDKSLFDRMAPHLFLNKLPAEQQHHKPFLKLFIVGLIHTDAVPILDYLLKHGAGRDREEVYSLLTFSASQAFGPFPFIFEYLWNSGYQTLNDQYLTEIYHSPSILFREAFNSIIFGDDTSVLLAKSKYLLCEAVCFGHLTDMRYYHQKGVSFEYSTFRRGYFSISNQCWNYRYLDALKYLLTHYQKDITEIDRQLQLGLYEAAKKDQLQTVHYLVNRCLYSQEMIIKARKVARGSAKKYLLLYNPETGLDLNENLEEFDNIEKLEQFENFTKDWKNKLLRRYNKDLFVHPCIRLALINDISKKDAKPVELQDYIIFRLNLINRLLPLDLFAADYAWALFFYFIKNEEIFNNPESFLTEYSFSFDDLLLFFSKAYKLYVYKTKHIVEMHARDIFNKALQCDNDLKSPESLSILRAIKAGLVLTPVSGEQLLPAALSSLVSQYVDFRCAPVTSGLTHLVVSGLTHLLQAIYSKKKCLHCNFDFSKQKNISFFSSQHEKIVVAPTAEIKPSSSRS